MVQLGHQHTHQGNRQCRRAESRDIPGRQAPRHIPDEVPDLHLPHRHRLIEAQRLLVDLCRFRCAHVLLHAGLGIPVFVSAALGGRQRNHGPVLPAPDHGAHGVPLPSLGQDDLPVEDPGPADQVVHPVPQSPHIRRNLPFLHAEIAQQPGNRVADVRLVPQAAPDPFPRHTPGDLLKGVAQQLPLVLLPVFNLIIEPTHR